MSLIVFATTSEGIVLAGDSRQSYINRRGMVKTGSDNVFKIFELNNMVGMGATGLGTMIENNTNKSIRKFVEEFKKSVDIQNKGVTEVSKIVYDWFLSKYDLDSKIKTLRDRLNVDYKMQNLEIIDMTNTKTELTIEYYDYEKRVCEKKYPFPKELNFMITGFNNDGTYELYSMSIPGEIEKKRTSNMIGMEYGVNWEGQADIVGRILKGYDFRISNISFVQESIDKYGKDTINNQLNNLQYSIQWGTMPLQDAVEFCELIIKTTIAIQKFSDGIIADPGEVAGVGGEIDIAVIKPETGFSWVKRKNII